MSEPVLDDAVRSLRRLILAGEHYRQSIAQVTGLGVTETQAMSYLAVHGPRGQNELAADLGITSSASTALVDRLERQGVAERVAHPSDRRRVQVQLTEGGRAVIQLSHDWLASAFEDLPEASVKELSCELVRIADSLRAASLRMLAERG